MNRLGTVCFKIHIHLHLLYLIQNVRPVIFVRENLKVISVTKVIPLRRNNVLEMLIADIGRRPEPLIEVKNAIGEVRPMLPLKLLLANLLDKEELTYIGCAANICAG